MASDTQAMVLAVYWPPQAPSPGQATALQGAEVVQGQVAGGMLTDGLEHVDHGDVPPLPAPGQDRAAVEEHRTGTFRRSMAIIMPGSDLSQPAMPTRAS